MQTVGCHPINYVYRSMSKDNTRKNLRELCAEDTHVKAIFNMKNFGQFNSPYYGLCQTTGDCAILLCCDFQDLWDEFVAGSAPVLIGVFFLGGVQLAFIG